MILKVLIEPVRLLWATSVKHRHSLGATKIFLILQLLGVLAMESIFVDVRSLEFF